jgi:hypothetical protein
MQGDTMSLGDVLNDLKSDVTNIDTSDTTVALENIAFTDEKKDSRFPSVQRLSKETVNKLNNMFNLIVLKQNIKGMQRVDRNVALEVFTMLPEVGNVEQAKLTSVPSVMNKEIMERVFNSNIEHKMSLDVVNKIYELEQLIENHIPMIDTLANYFETFNSTVSAKVETFKNNPPMIVEYKAYVSQDETNATRNVDVFTERLDVLLRIDDSKIEYPKYEGVLINKLSDIYHGDTLGLLYGTIVYVPALTELSLAGVVNIGKGMIDTLTNYKSSLNNYLSGINTVRRQESELNAETIDFVNGYEDMALKLETIGKLISIIETPNNCFDVTAELLEFID